MTPTSVLILTLYLAILVIVLTAAVGIRADRRRLPPLPDRLRERAEALEAAERADVTDHEDRSDGDPAPASHGAGRAPVAAGPRARTVESLVADAHDAGRGWWRWLRRTTPQLPGRARTLGRHVAGRAERGRQSFDRGAVHHLPRAILPFLRRMRPVRSRTEQFTLTLLGPVQRGIERAVPAGPQSRAGGALPRPEGVPQESAITPDGVPAPGATAASGSGPPTVPLPTTTPGEPLPTPSAAALSAARRALAGEPADEVNGSALPALPARQAPQAQPTEIDLRDPAGAQADRPVRAR